MHEHDGGFDVTGLGTVFAAGVDARATPEHRLRARENLQGKLAVDDANAVAEVPLLLVDLLVIELVGPDELEAGLRTGAERGDEQEQIQES
jgi:hypothetical protein